MRHPMSMKESPVKRFGVARILSKQGLASRTQAATWVREGRVSVNGRVVRDPEFPVVQERDRVSVDGLNEKLVENIYLILNKPRGLVTTTNDEKGRDTVYRCFDGADLPWLAPVGRLDKASEGLLLFTNDTAWAARITSPESGLDKTYHVQINRVPNSSELENMRQGVLVDGELHAMKKVVVLREGKKNAWLEIILDEGKNRQIRKILADVNIDVLRLIRIQIGDLKLGELPKGKWRLLDTDETAVLS
ncbi:MAG: pseudouridine synthase [Arenimonas sp.]